MCPGRAGAASHQGSVSDRRNTLPSTERHDRRVKLPAYRQIETVQEILLVASDDAYAEIHRRAGAQWITEILRGGEAALSLASVPIEIRLSNLYEGIALVDAASNRAAET